MRICPPAARWGWPVLVLLLLASARGICLGPASTPSANEIVRKAIAHAQASKDDLRRGNYGYTKQVIVEDLDTQGRVTEVKEKLFRFQSGLALLEQFKINGRIADGARVKKEEEHLARQGAQLTDGKASRRDDHWEKYLTPALAAKYQFTLRGQELVNGRPAYVIAFRPRSGDLPVHQIVDHLLNQLGGTVWVDQQEFEIARADISAQSKVALGGMMELLGSLKKFNFALERIRLEEGIWFNRLTTGDFQGRRLLDNTHVRTRSVTNGIRKISSGK